MADVTIKSGDLLPAVTAQFLDAEGNEIDLSAADAVTFSMRGIRATSAVILAAPANIVSAAHGRVSYEWQPGDTDVPGGYYGEFEAMFGSEPETFPRASYLTIAIVQDLGTGGGSGS